MQILDWPLLTPTQRANTDAQLRAGGYRPLSGTVDYNNAGIPDYEVAGSPNDTSNQGTTSTGLAFGGANLSSQSWQSHMAAGAKAVATVPTWVWLAGAAIVALVIMGRKHG